MDIAARNLLLAKGNMVQVGSRTLWPLNVNFKIVFVFFPYALQVK